MILHISETLNVSHCLGDALPEYLWITFRPHVSGPAKLHACRLHQQCSISVVHLLCLLDPLAFGVTQPSQPLTVFSGESGSTSSKAPLTLSPSTEIMRS